MKKLVVLLALLALVAALSAYETVAQVKEGEESEILWKKIPNDYNLESSFISAVFTPDESKILIGNKLKLLEVDAATGSLIREIPGIYGARKFSDDGQYFYTYDLKKVRYSTMEVLGQYIDSFPLAWKISDFEMNDKAGLYIMTVQHASPPQFNSIFIYDLNTFKLKKITGIKDHYITDVEISSNGDYFLIGSYYYTDPSKPESIKSTVTIWDTKTLEQIGENRELLGYRKFSPDGNWLAVTLWNKVKIYDAKKFEKKWENKHESENIDVLPYIAFSPDSRYLITANNGSPNYRNPHIWEVKTGKLFSKYTQFNTPWDMEFEQIFMNKNYQVLVYSAGAVFMLNSKTNSIISPLNKIYSFEYNPNAKKITFKYNNQSDKMPIIDIFNETGIRINNINPTLLYQNSVIIDVSNLPSGAYFARIIINNIPYTEKFIKE